MERWLYLQVLWMNLEAVFTGGDIAKQLPQDSKRFSQIDKSYVKMMLKAYEVQNCITLCHGQDMVDFLMPLIAGLEQCQKSLSTYLEQKRGLFPRFYFVSDPVLLEILSQGSDPHAIQPYFQANFDSIDSVAFESSNPEDKKAKPQIVTLYALVGNENEELNLSYPVLTDGNIETWMGKLETTMQETVQDVVRRAAVDCQAMPLKDFIPVYCAQVCLLGLQMQWTQDVQEAIIRGKKEKHAFTDAQSKVGGVMQELCVMTTDDSLGKRDRTNILNLES